MSANTSSGLQRLMFEAPKPISSAVLSTDGKLVALALESNAIILFDREKAKPLTTLTQISKSITAMHFSQNRRFFVAVGKDRSRNMFVNETSLLLS